MSGAQKNIVYVCGVLLVVMTFGLVQRAIGAADERARASADALATVRKVELPALRDSLQQARDSNTLHLSRVDTLIRVRTVTVARADTIRVTADSLAIVARLTSDTGAVCRPIWTAYQVRTSECQQLRVAVQEDSAALREARNGLESSGTALRSALGQVAGLQERLAVVAKPYQCRIVWFVPCLSRKLSFVAGLVGGGVLVWRVQH